MWQGTLHGVVGLLWACSLGKFPFLPLELGQPERQKTANTNKNKINREVVLSPSKPCLRARSPRSMRKPLAVPTRDGSTHVDGVRPQKSQILFGAAHPCPPSGGASLLTHMGGDGCLNKRLPRSPPDLGTGLHNSITTAHCETKRNSRLRVLPPGGRRVHRRPQSSAKQPP